MLQMMAELGIHDNLSKMVDEQLLKTEVAVMTGRSVGRIF